MKKNILASWGQIIYFLIILYLIVFVIYKPASADCLITVSSFDNNYIDRIDGPYVDKGNGTIIDQGTGMTWQQADDGKLYTWSEACQYCQLLKLGGYIWELPNIFALKTIVNKNYLPSINTEYFYYTKGMSYWSGSTDANVTEHAFNVDFASGKVQIRDKKLYRYVRCVSSGQTVLPAPLAVSITASEKTGIYPFQVSFTSSVNGGISPYTFLWNFGDNTSLSSEQNPKHIYVHSGSYTALVTIKDSTGATTNASTIISVVSDSGLTPIPTTQIVKFLTTEEEISKGSVQYLSGNLTLNFPAYNAPIDIYIAFYTEKEGLLFIDSTGQIIKNIESYSVSALLKISDSFSISNSTLFSNINDRDCNLYYLIAPANGGDIFQSLAGPFELVGYKINNNIIDNGTLSAGIIALPETGNAPLSVKFIPNVFTNNAVEQYEWDFEGDGIFEIRDVVGRNQSYIYKKPGTYKVSLKITDNKDIQTIGTAAIKVNNSPSVISAEAVPSNGQIPLNVNFQVTATDNEGIGNYEWDFEGDGIYDYSSATSGNTSHSYTTVGTYKPVLKITDSLGASTIYIELTTEVRAAPAGSPTVKITASPQTGAVPLNVSFTASASDPNSSITDFAWDFNGDAVFDQNGSSSNISYNYQTPGTYSARVRVKSGDNGTAEDIVKIIVKPTLTLSVSADTIDSNIGEISTITTTLGGTTRISLVMEDKNGSVVKTIVPWTDRAGGTYNDIWAGDDKNSSVVSEGDYYAVLLYELNGKQERFDLALTTGGTQYNPSRSSIPSTFSPFAGQPLSIDFTLTKTSQVTAFIGQYNVDARWVTFMQRYPLGKGSHRITWNGTNSDGIITHPPSGDSFLFGIFAYYLPDNAVYVRSGAHISGLAVTPSIYDPLGFETDGSPKKSSLSFDLSKSSTVEMVVSDAESGKVVAKKSFPRLQAGQNTITWDGKTDDGIFVSAGRYRLGTTAVDDNGFRSITLYMMQRVYY